jgi:hypothetical protein
MESYEEYARRVINGLSTPDEINPDQLLSPMEGAYENLKGQLLDVDIEAGDLENTGENPQLLPFDVSDTENGILASGIESLAFYKSIHHENLPPFAGTWGIFIFDYSLDYLSEELQRHAPGKFSPRECKQRALKLLYFHERFHFRFDTWVLSAESATGKPLYENYRNNIYRAFHPQEYVYEESLANLHALSCIAKEGAFSFAKDFMLSQPGSYSNIAGVNRGEYRSCLAAQLFHGRKQIMNDPFALPEHSEFLAQPKNPSLSDKWCPVRIVQGVSPSIFVIPSVTLPALGEIENGFLKKYLKGKEARTDHKYYKIDNGSKVKCPNPHDKHVRLYEFKNITGKAGLKIKEYFEQRDKTKKWRKNVPRNKIIPALF